MTGVSMAQADVSVIAADVSFTGMGVALSPPTDVSQIALFDPAALAIINAFTTPPTLGRGALINKFVLALKGAGVWPLLDMLYIFAAATQQAALLNWKNPGTFTATLTNAPTFAADRGFTGNGTTSFVDSGYAPATNGINFTQNAASIGARVLTYAADGFGFFGGGNEGLFDGNGVCFVQINAAGGASYSIANSPGSYIGSRSNSANVAAYQNGGNKSTLASASAAIAAGTLTACKAGTSFTTCQVASCFAGGSLTDSQVAAYYAAELAYMQGVGAA